MGKTRLAFPLLAAALLMEGCGGGSSNGGSTTPTLNPASIVISPPGGLSFDALQATQQLSATVRDQQGATISAQIQWASDDPTVASISGSGMVTALKNGSTRITATAGAVSASTTATVQQRASVLTVTSGSNQSGPVGAALQAPLVVTAQDSRANPVPGVAVSFAASGGGSVSTTSATTAANGQASTVWTLGTRTTDAQSVVASLAGAAGTTATFTATPLAGPPVSAAKFSGDNQQWSVTKPLPDPIAVRVIDRFNNGVPGATVSFVVTAGGGSVSATDVVSDANGEARVTWTLGPQEGGQSVRAQLATPATLLPFFATGLRVDLGSVGPTPFRVGCQISLRGTGFNLTTLSKNRVAIDGVDAQIVDGNLQGDLTVLDVIVPTLPNAAAHFAVIEVTSYGSTVSGAFAFDPQTDQC